MYQFKSVKLYFSSILKLIFLSFKNFYFKSKYYNKKLITLIPERIFYSPSTYLCASLITIGNDFYKVSDQNLKFFWKINKKNNSEFENLHNFLWLTRIDRKNSNVIIKNIIKSWMDIFFNYDHDVWEVEITSKRIIAWSSNIDVILQNSEKKYKEKVFLCLIKHSNYLLNNLTDLNHGKKKIICCAAIILNGIMFKENFSNYKIGIKELEKIIKNFFDENGFPKSRNPEDVFICLKYLILIREWLKEAQKEIPDFLNEVINNCGKCYIFLTSLNKQFPLFNGATEVDSKDYDIFLKSLKYKFINNNHSIGDLVKIKKKKFDLFFDCGNPPSSNFAKQYQAGCLSFELISNKQKIICNTGYGKYLTPELEEVSRSTAAHSTLYINNTSSCSFRGNKFINKMHGHSLTHKHKIVKSEYTEDKDFYNVSASHNGYEKRFGYTHIRSIKVSKKNDKIFGQDVLKKTRNYSPHYLNYFIRFHIYPNTKIVKTKAGNSILISLINGEGWLLTSNTNSLKIEKNIFLGNKKKIINSESVCISGDINNEIISIKWEIERINR
jgi:uncharacterized heparinase superfamily protein